MITVALMIPHRLDYNLALKGCFLGFSAAAVALHVASKIL
jgi:hypothetical protein